MSPSEFSLFWDLTSSFLDSSLHGCPLLDAGLVTLNTALTTHPGLVCLDLGDCMLGDEALALICGMLPPDGAKSGKTLFILSFLSGEVDCPGNQYTHHGGTYRHKQLSIVMCTLTVQSEHPLYGSCMLLGFESKLEFI